MAQYDDSRWPMVIGILGAGAVVAGVLAFLRYADDASAPVALRPPAAEPAPAEPAFWPTEPAPAGVLDAEEAAVSEPAVTSAEALVGDLAATSEPDPQAVAVSEPDAASAEGLVGDLAATSEPDAQAVAVSEPDAASAEALVGDLAAPEPSPVEPFREPTEAPAAAAAPTASEPPPAPPSAGEPAPVSAAEPPPAATAEPAPKAAQPAPDPAPEPEESAFRPPYELRIRATARQVWVWVAADGGGRQAVSLERGETATFEAKQGYEVTVDDAGGVEATLNGKSLGSLGPSGQARRDIVLPPQF